MESKTCSKISSEVLADCYSALFVPMLVKWRKHLQLHRFQQDSTMLLLAPLQNMLVDNYKEVLRVAGILGKHIAYTEGTHIISFGLMSFNDFGVLHVLTLIHVCVTSKIGFLATGGLTDITDFPQVGYMSTCFSVSLFC